MQVVVVLYRHLTPDSKAFQRLDTLATILLLYQRRRRFPFLSLCWVGLLCSRLVLLGVGSSALQSLVYTLHNAGVIDIIT